MQSQNGVQREKFSAIICSLNAMVDIQKKTLLMPILHRDIERECLCVCMHVVVYIRVLFWGGDTIGCMQVYTSPDRPLIDLHETRPSASPPDLVAAVHCVPCCR